MEEHTQPFDSIPMYPCMAYQALERKWIENRMDLIETLKTVLRLQSFDGWIAVSLEVCRHLRNKGDTVA